MTSMEGATRDQLILGYVGNLRVLLERRGGFDSLEQRKRYSRADLIEKLEILAEEIESLWPEAPSNDPA